MKLVFISNYFNHHQSALSGALLRCTEGKYRFVSTGDMREERKKLGYGGEEEPFYVLHAHRGDQLTAKQQIAEADAVIVGSAPETMVAQHIRAGKLTYRYTERLLKKRINPIQWAKRFVLLHCRNPRRKPIYLLCAGGYVAADYAKFGLFKNRTYQWGYFPQTIEYQNVDALLAGKQENQILWAGRLIDWKHPEHAVDLAARLKASGYNFTLNIIGSGDMEAQLQRQIEAKELTDRVRLLGSMKPQAVRKYMEAASIFVATSDKQEGWGAVINEAMNSGCAVVASHAIGAVPYLIRDGENGLIYRSGDADMLYQQVRVLLSNVDQQKNLGKNAYKTIATLWNAEVAAQRLNDLSKAILAGDKQPDLYESGPCSKARILHDDWM